MLIRVGVRRHDRLDVISDAVANGTEVAVGDGDLAVAVGGARRRSSSAASPAIRRSFTLVLRVLRQRARRPWSGSAQPIRLYEG